MVVVVVVVEVGLGLGFPEWTLLCAIIRQENPVAESLRSLTKCAITLENTYWEIIYLPNLLTYIVKNNF